MAGWKGSILVDTRELVKRYNREEDVLQKLSEELQSIYKKTLPVSWIPVEKGELILKVISEVLYPNDPKAAFKIGVDIAKKHFDGGIYKVIMRVVSIEMILKKTAKIWSTFHQKGIAQSAFETSKKQGVLSVTGYSDLPENIRRGAGGYAYGIIQLTKIQGLNMIEDYSDPDNWKWIFTWQA
jgi:hypothetical protein